MRTQVIRLLAFTIFSVFISMVISSVLMLVLMGGVPRTGLIISAFVPILAGLPIMWAMDRQRQKLRDALAELESAQDQLESLNRELKRQARYDFMTGAMNRRYLFKTVTENWQESQSGVLMCIDVDDFKRINDSYGHSVGDIALKEITKAITGVTRRADTIARIGGEEFAVFVPRTDYAQARYIAERIRAAVEAICFSPNDTVMHPLSVSIGSAFVTEVGNVEELVDIADKRMYRAKQKGKNQVVLPRRNDLAKVA